MGQDASTPETLESRTLEGIARYIKDGKAKKIVIMTGAGISTSAGIPDFRSPETGLYANLARFDLPHAESVFEISYFRNNPNPFYMLAQELDPSKFRPTITHSFIKLVHDKGLLLKLFTQNIDCLESRAGVPSDSIIEAHGSFATASCIECKSRYLPEKMLEVVRKGSVPQCEDDTCRGLVKPNIVFYGEPMPESFSQNKTLPADADLAIVMGTSLTVYPFASLPGFCGEGVPRLLINNEQVGSLGSRPDDVLLLEDCDSGVRKLAKALGWLEELETEWAKTARPEDKIEKKAEEQKPREETLNEAVEKLTKEVDKALKLSSDHSTSTTQMLNKEKEKQDVAGLRDGDDNKTVMHAPMGAQTINPDGNQMKDEPKRSSDDIGGGDCLNHVFPHIGQRPSL
ncbi:putative SIR2 family histone deacetylase [Patellaria atrata CBS 101060]|uniref:NAD-dependent protein deacetylase n=1 Tax=Patellaria atrata CBS 101060 TaxID=1346257 RepID=A0A9P4VM68_9PEZI|nr:putative SIR2 family histone deacetylase [Patellaria atrata CBS 101060]